MIEAIIGLAYLTGAICFARFLVWQLAQWSWSRQEWSYDDTFLVIILSAVWPVSLPIVSFFVLFAVMKRKWDGQYLPFATWFEKDRERRNNK